MPILPFRANAVAAVAGVATLNQDAAIVTTQALATAANGSATITLNCSAVTPTSLVMASLQNGSNTTGIPAIQTVTPGNGVVTIVIQNLSGAAALNGTLILSVLVFN
jgi:hypothetical protein